jgi:hypothetical protein
VVNVFIVLQRSLVIIIIKFREVFKLPRSMGIIRLRVWWWRRRDFNVTSEHGAFNDEVQLLYLVLWEEFDSEATVEVIELGITSGASWMLETGATGEGGKENLAGVFLRETTPKSGQHIMSTRQISNCHLTMSSTELDSVTEVLGKELGSDRPTGDTRATAGVEGSQNRMSTRHISNCLLTI